MQLSARNQLKTVICDIKSGAVNSQISGKLDSGETLSATITLASEKELDLKVGKEAYFIFKAPSVIIAKKDANAMKLSARNQLSGKISEIKTGAVNSEILVNIGGEQVISAIITNQSASDMALSVGDEVIAIIKANNMIIGVK